jgi:hypothetical protein
MRRAWTVSDSRGTTRRLLGVFTSSTSHTAPCLSRQKATGPRLSVGRGPDTISKEVFELTEAKPPLEGHVYSLTRTDWRIHFLSKTNSASAPPWPRGSIGSIAMNELPIAKT